MSLPMSEDDSQLVVGHSGSGAEALATKVPKAHVVSAFSTVPSEMLLSMFEARRKGAPPDLVFCGNNEGAKKTGSGTQASIILIWVPCRPLVTSSRFRC
jgi:8-hydroxy-5-deazaflavin:NADPH oxidoreductase